MTDKSLGKIAFGTHYLPVGSTSYAFDFNWDDMTSSQRERWERTAQAVKAHVLDAAGMPYVTDTVYTWPDSSGTKPRDTAQPRGDGIEALVKRACERANVAFIALLFDDIMPIVVCEQGGRYQAIDAGYLTGCQQPTSQQREDTLRDHIRDSFT